MAAQGRTTGYSLEHTLFEEPYRFDFFQAVRLLERLHPERGPVGRDAKPSEEVVRFCALLSLSFPASAIHDLRRARNDGPDEMVLAFIGLVGPLGVLPRHYTELLLERTRNKDTALRDFLDLFNHRLVSLFYRAWEKYRFPLAYERMRLRGDQPDRFSQYLFDLIGMGTNGLRGRLAVQDEALLFYAGLIAQRPHSATALEQLLGDYFRVPAGVAQFIGEWLPLAEDNRTRLGAADGNSVLGASVIAGSRVWDQQARFRVQVGPLRLIEFDRFLPTNDAFRRLVELTRFFVGQEPSFDVQLVLRAAEVPWCQLGATGPAAPRLGWTTWLKSAEFRRDADDVVLPGEMPAPAGASASASTVQGERAAA